MWPCVHCSYSCPNSCSCESSGVPAGSGRHVPAPVQELRDRRQCGQCYVLLQQGQWEAYLCRQGPLVRSHQRGQEAERVGLSLLLLTLLELQPSDALEKIQRSCNSCSNGVCCSCRYIVSDCDSVDVLYNNQHYTKNPEDAAAITIKSGTVHSLVTTTS